MTEEEFQLIVEGFLARYSLSPTTFGLWALNDSRFVFDLRRGRSCSLSTVAKVRQFMDEYQRKQEARRRRELDAQSTKGAIPEVGIKSAGTGK